MYVCSIKFLRTAYLIWQIFLKKLSLFLIAINEFHSKIVNPTVIFLWVYNSKLKKTDLKLLLSKLTSNWMHIYALFNERCWCSCPMCVKNRRCSTPRSYWCRRFITCETQCCKTEIFEWYWTMTEKVPFWIKW